MNDDDMMSALEQLKADNEMMNRPRAVSLVTRFGSLYKLYTDGSVYMWTGDGGWTPVPDDNKFTKE